MYAGNQQLSFTSEMDITALRRAERALRALVDASPEATDARRDLAWCLLLQVFYWAGYEDCVHRMSEMQQGVESPREELIPDRPISELLAECLWQATILPAISSDEATRVDRERLISLAKMAGRAREVDAAQRRGDQVLRVLIRDIDRGDEHPNTAAELAGGATA
jgi:hypothetical protein